MCTLSSNSNFGGNANPLAIQVSKRKFEVNNGLIHGAYRKATGQLVTVACTVVEQVVLECAELGLWPVADVIQSVRRWKG